MTYYKLPQDLKNRIEKFLYKDLDTDPTGVETNELLDGLEALNEIGDN